MSHFQLHTTVLRLTKNKKKKVKSKQSYKSFHMPPIFREQNERRRRRKKEETAIQRTTTNCKVRRKKSKRFPFFCVAIPLSFTRRIRRMVLTERKATQENVQPEE